MEFVCIYIGILNFVAGVKMLYDTLTQCPYGKSLQTACIAVSCLPITTSYYLLKGIVF